MLLITGTKLEKMDRKLIRLYARFVLNRYVTKSIQKKSVINIKILTNDSFYKESKDKDCSAYTTYEKIVDSTRHFRITMNYMFINSKAKRPHTRMSAFLTDLGHELIHVKQYLNGQIFDYANGDIRYGGKVFSKDYCESDEDYYESPWEIEAYGRESGLYKMFYNKMKEDGIY
jgi:hypothetical protein